MRKFILNILLLIGIAGAGVLAAWLVRSCCGSKDGGLSPEETVKAFYSSLMAGDWEEAEDLSASTDDMKTYFLTFRQFWDKAQKTDSLSLSLASEMLSGADVSLSKDFKIGAVQLRIAGELNNVFNQAYEVIHNYPMPGRNFRLTAKVTI